MTTYIDQKGKDITLAVNNIIAEITDLAKRKKIDLVSHGRIVAIYCAQELEGNVQIGWHYAGQEDAIGTEFHYDHGAGIQRNTDGRYLWISPKTVSELNSSGKMICRECSNEMEIDYNGISNHINNDGIDHDEDADHVAIWDNKA